MSESIEITDQQASHFRGIMGSFGTSIPQISTVVAIVIGSLGLRRYFDAGAWTVIALLSFSIVYLFRRQLPRTVPTACLFVVLLLLILGGSGFVLWTRGVVPHDPMAWSETAKSLGSAYVALLLTLPLAVLITSYQHQEEVFGMTFPKQIDLAAQQQLLTVPFYKSKVTLTSKFEKMDADGIELVNEMSYKVTNRTKEKREWNMEYDFSDKHAQIETIEVDGQPVDKDDLKNKYRFNEGVRIPLDVKPRKSHTIYFRVRQRYRLEDGEIYSSYTPATDLTVTVVNPFDEIEVYLEGLSRSAKKDSAGNKKVMILKEGVLPYQGVRARWRRKADEHA